MTTTEFSNEFDVLYNNIASNSAPGLNEYEKSVFLTKAQSEIVKAYFISNTNKSRSGFDGDEKRQYDFSVLLRIANLYNVNSAVERISTTEKIDKRSQVYLFPSDYFISVNELLSDSNQFYSVQPITYTDYQRMMTKPYPYPPKRVAWRLLTDKKFCNSLQASITDETAPFEMLTGWADKKTSLKVTFTLNADTPIVREESKGEEYVENNIITMYSVDLEDYAQIQMKGNLDKDNCYNIEFIVNTEVPEDGIDLSLYIEVIKKAFECYFKLVEKQPTIENPSNIIEKAYIYTDGLKNCTITGSLSVKDLTYPLKNTTISLPMAEIIGKFDGSLQYQMRYIKRPKPIILESLSNNVSIEGVQKVTECELAEELHPEILQRAVELAKAAYIGDLNSTISVGNVSATNLGITASSN